MKKLGVIASFMLVLAAITTIGSRHAAAAILESKISTPGVYACADSIAATKSSDAIIINGCIQILSFGYTIVGEVTEATTGKDGQTVKQQGIVQVGEVVITKAFDKILTPLLIMTSIEGRTWEELRIEVYIPAECTPVNCDPDIAVIMNGVIVKSIVTDAVSSIGEIGTVVETITVIGATTRVEFTQ